MDRVSAIKIYYYYIVDPVVRSTKNLVFFQKKTVKIEH